MAEAARNMGVNIISMGERVCGKSVHFFILIEKKKKKKKKKHAEEIVVGFLEAKGGRDEEFEKYVAKFDEKYLAK